MRWGWAIFGGLTGAALVVGLFAWDRSRNWQLRAARTAHTLQTRGSDLELALTSSGEKLRDELAAEGRRLAENAARAEAQRVLGVEYGLTPDRLERLDRVGHRLGV
jgi:hypothetical protein